MFCALTGPGYTKGGNLSIFVHGLDRFKSFYWPTYFPPTVSCPGREYRPQFTSDPQIAHAVYFNLPTLIESLDEKCFPTFYRDQKTIAISHEKLEPGFHPHPLLDYEQSLRATAELPDSFLCELLQNGSNLLHAPNVAEKTKGVAAFISNCAEPRLSLLRALMKHMRVDSFGACERNMPPLGSGRDDSNWEQRKHAIVVGFVVACACFISTSVPPLHFIQ